MKKNTNLKNQSKNILPKSGHLQDIINNSDNEDIEVKTINTFDSLNTLDEDFTKKEYKTPFQIKSDMHNKLKEKLKLINPISKNYVNEIMKSELKKLAKENVELKFCLNKLNNKCDTELKKLKLQNINKCKEIDHAQKIIKKNASLIELLGGKIINYEKIFKEIKLKRQQKEKFDKDIKDKLLNAKKENEELKKNINERNEIINSFKDEIDSKKDVFNEMDKMKSDMETYLKTMDKLYKEIEEKDKEIDQLKNNIELLDKKHKQEIENISKNKNNNNNIDNVNQNISSNEELLNEITKSKEKQIKITKELIDTQNNYNIAKNNNIKMQKLTKEASDMIKQSIVERDAMKEEYDKAIKELVDQYEKEVQYMKVLIVEQNNKFEKTIDDLKQGKNIDDIKDNDILKEFGKDIEEQNKNLEKLKTDNTMLIKQNLELRKMNEMLLSKVKDLPNINNKFNELFEKIKLLKEENDLLKKSMENNKFFQMLNKKHEEEEKHNENEKENNENENEIEEHLNKGKEEENSNREKENENDDGNQKLNIDELNMLEGILKDVESGNAGDPEANEKKLEFLEKILKKLENKNDIDNIEENNNNNEEEREENEEEEKNNEYLNLQKQLLLEEMLKQLKEKDIEEIDDNIEDKKDDTNIDKDKDLPDKENKENNSKNDESLKDKNNKNDINKPIKIYNKKFFKAPPNINSTVNKNKDKKKINENKNNEIKTEEENEEEEEDEENIPNQINENFYLFKPTKEGILSFSLSKKDYSTTIPNKYDEFLKVFDPETFVQYNTLEGLFIIPSNKCNELYNYSNKKNTICELFTLKENHSGGCLFLDNISKNIIALGGYESKAVEKFSFETGKLVQLPELSTYRSKIACNQIGNKIYCFFGISKEKPNESIVEYLDLDDIKQGWKEIEFENSAEFDVISGMSCINLNDNELLIIGGLLNDKIPNEKLLYVNIENKKIIKLDKNLPDSEDKVYLFTQNTMFNLFVNGEMTSFANIDNNNQVHILDDELCYDLYLTPKIE